MTLKVLLGALATVAALGTVAYAAVRPDFGSGRRGGGLHESGGLSVPATPRIVGHPAKLATSSTARFHLVGPTRPIEYQCRLDRGPWRRCRTKIVLRGIRPGPHTFSARVVHRGDPPGLPARFHWRLLVPKAFSIKPELSRLPPLYPGGPAATLHLVVGNPNPVPILVTGLWATATSSHPGCSSAENLELMPSNVSRRAPLRISPQGSIALPTTKVSAPTIRLRDLPVNQDACQGAHFPLKFFGSAHG